MKKKAKLILGCTAVLLGVGMLLGGCGQDSKTQDGKIQIEMVHYKPEAVKAFKKKWKKNSMRLMKTSS